MANIRIKSLPPDLVPTLSDVTVLDGGTADSVRKVTLEVLGDTVRPYASGSEAVAGTVSNKAMSPLLTKAAINAASAQFVVDFGNARQRLATGAAKYVNASTGDDITGDGSSALPWATLAKAIDYLYSIDLAGQPIAIACTGTFVERLSIVRPIVGAKDHTSVTFFSQSGTPSDFTIAPDTISEALPAIEAKGGARFSVTTFRAEDAYHGCVSQDGSYLRLQDYEFGDLFNGSGSSHESACFLSINGGEMEVYGGGLVDGNVDTIFNVQHSSFMLINGPATGTETLTISNNLTINEIHYIRSNSLIRYSSSVTWAYSIGAATEANLRPYRLIMNGVLAYANVTEPAFGCTTLPGLEEANGKLWKNQTERPIVGTFEIDLTTSGTQSITVGYRPRFMIFVGSVNAAAGKATWGVLGNSTNYGANISDYHTGTANSFLTSNLSTGQIMRFGDASDANVITITSFDNDGITFTKTPVGSPTGTARVCYLAHSAP